ncbi:hypothetical protein Sjap_014165 [Stephania japonica]|uniref:RING-type domain-containing protein n=1 Tax=Stephania japonica TaxID=461633 RepID=A0AAP0J149_9MAGN
MDSSSTHIIPDLNSNDGKVMLAALVSLIVVLSFVLALHVYARWFMGQARRRLRRPTTVVTPMTHLHSQRPQLDGFQIGLGAIDGLDASAIARLPMFMYKSGVNEAGLECAICLSVFEDDEMGRVLPKCQHCFHVECIDMWLQWRSNCPICRAIVASPESSSSSTVVVDISSEVAVAVAVQVSVGTTNTMSGETANSTRAHESSGSLEVQIEMPVDHTSALTEHQVQKISGAVAHNGCSLKRMLSMNRFLFLQMHGRLGVLESALLGSPTGLISSWVEGQCLDEQRQLLLYFKGSLSFFSESGVPVGLSSWELSTDCCRRWEGVECNQIGEVIGLDLSNKSINGTNDGLASLFQLRRLHGLNLSNNNFNSAIPSGFDRLPNLTHLNLSNSGFVGQIPIGISRLARLVSLDLSTIFAGIMNPLKLEDPDLRTLVGNLSELRELRLDGVNVSYNGNEWAQIFSSSLPKLEVLSLSSCSLSGPFDPSLSKLRSLSELWLAQNNFSAEIPEFFGSFSNLTVLHLTNCGLQGKFPQNIFKLPKLKHLHLSLNPMLKGSLPEFSQYNSLQFLILSSTSFSGELPSSIGNLKYLSKLDLFNCHFNGSIPPTVTNLSQLLYLDLSSNSFTGPIPSLSLSKNLTSINLSNNLLSGLIPHFDPGDFKNLVNLYLRNNSLNGSIPSSLFTLPSLKKLDLSFNQIGGSLGEFPVDSLLQLETLDLSSNKLGGAVPLSIFNITSLKVVALSSNQFNGTLEFRKFEALNNISNLDLSGNLLSVSASGVNSALFPQLTTLKLSSCNLKVVPQFLKNQSKLTYLDLSNNNIGGNIPSWMENIGNGSINYLNLSCNSLENPERPFSNGSFRELSVLDLHSNRFQGPIPILPPSASFLDYSKNNLNIIPTSIGSSLSTAIFLSLASNNIHGNLPGSLCQAGNIQVLDLSNNSFSGAIPSCPEGIGGPLRVLNLRRNHLSGTMNAVFREDCALRTIDLSGNRFEGEVSRSLGNCTKLEVLNIGNNHFSGTFPHWLGALSQLRVLVLRSNSFGGPIGIPQPGSTFSMLQIVDISSNKFNGSVPAACFSSWKSMRNDEDETELMAKHQILKYSFFEFSSFYYQDEVTVTRRKWYDEQTDKASLMILSSFGLLRHICREERINVEEIEDDDPDDDKEEEDMAQSGRYCVFCSKLDSSRTRAAHNPKCTCHVSPIFSSL